jgi:hypothetical protein
MENENIKSKTQKIKDMLKLIPNDLVVSIDDLKEIFDYYDI